MHSQTRNNANAETNSKQQGAIAQLVEQRTENPCVPGSIPGGTTLKKSNPRQTPDFQTKSGVFVFWWDAKTVIYILVLRRRRWKNKKDRLVDLFRVNSRIKVKRKFVSLQLVILRNLAQNAADFR